MYGSFGFCKVFYKILSCLRGYNWENGLRKPNRLINELGDLEEKFLFLELGVILQDMMFQ